MNLGKTDWLGEKNKDATIRGLRGYRDHAQRPWIWRADQKQQAAEQETDQEQMERDETDPRHVYTSGSRDRAS